MSRLLNLRPHQTNGITELKQSFLAGKRRPMLQAPTGAGKTVLAASLINNARSKKKRVLFCVPAISLIDQTFKEFYDEGITDVGVIQGNHPMTDWTQPIQIASIQTLLRRKLPEVDVAIIDEAHRWFDFYEEWFKLQEWQNKPIIGLSATPWTRGLGKHYDDLIVVATIQELIDAGYLSKFRVFAPAHPDLTGVKTVAGDYHEGQLAEAMNKQALVADIVDTWKMRGENRPTLCFAVDRAHAKHLQAQFQKAGVSTGYIDAYTDREERQAIERQFHSNEVKVVCNVGCLTTGIDWDVRCIVLARPTKSEMLFVQIIGRGLRTAEAKDDCLILDHSDNHLRLGFVTDIDVSHTELDDGKPKEKAEPKTKEILPKECPKCSYLKPPKMTTCPSCGFKPERKTDVEVEDGELQELLQGAPKGRSRQYTMQEKQVWWSGFLHIQNERGYKSTWAVAQYKKKFGVWPRSMHDVPAEPTLEIRSYVKSRMIAFAKRRAA